MTQLHIPPHLDASAQFLYEEAMSRGIECKTFPGSQIIAMNYQGKHWYTSGSRTSFQSAIGQTIADDKAITKIFLREVEAPTAQAVTVKTPADLPQLADLTWPLVMKPIKGAHGNGVVTNIPNLTAATTAFRAVQSPVLFEETLQGVEYRIVCIDFKFAAAAYRKPAFVTGDGEHTITELVELKNQHPWRETGHHGKLTTIVIDHTVESLLAEQHLSVSSIPQPAQEVQLRKTANLSTGGEACDVTDEVGAENQRLFEAIAQTCDLNIIGIDVMCQSLSQPLTQQTHAGIIEINKSPGLRMHHFPMAGQPRNLAQKIIDCAIAQANKS